MHDDRIIAEFTQQAETFNASAVGRAVRTLDDLVRLASPRPDQRWLEAACGPGLVSRHLAPRVLEVHGVDITPAVIEVAPREAAAVPSSWCSISPRASGPPDPLERPETARCFAVIERDGRRVLELRMWLSSWLRVD